MDNETIQTNNPTDHVVVTTPAPEPAPVAGTPQQQSRDAIYAKYYGNTEPTPTAPVAAEPAVVPAPEPAPAPTPAPAAVAVPDPETIKQMVTEIVRSMAAPQAPTQTTQPTPPAPAPVADPTAWVQSLIAGNFVEATDALKAQIMEEVKAKLAPELSRTTLTEATENFKAETELNTFVNSIRSENADIIKLEPLIAPKIQMAMAEWLQSQGGKVAPLAYVEQYKKVATAEINEARNIIQTFRAAGATGQQAVKQEVLSAATLTPTPLQAPQAQPSQPTVQDAKSYLQMRQNLTNMRNGMKLRN